MTLRESARSILPRPGQKNISAYATDERLGKYAEHWTLTQAVSRNN